MCEFKIGDRVVFNKNGVTDIGTIIQEYESDDTIHRWWIRWDSDSATLHAEETDLVLVQHEVSSINEEIESLKKRIKALENQYIKKG